MFLPVLQAEKNTHRVFQSLDEAETDDVFAIALPQDILKSHLGEIESGTLFISITNAELTEDDLLTTNESEYSVVPDRRLQALDYQWKNKMTIAIIMISTIDGSPTDSRETLENTYFGNGINLRIQYEACLFGQLQWELAPAGVEEVTVNQKISEFGSAA
jgi:hypothetical protein